MAIILDGRKLGEKVLVGVRKEAESRKLKLAVVFVGDNKVSGVYLRKKQEACEKAGIGFQIFGFPGNINGPELRKGIENIVRDPSNSGIVIQLPLPLNHLITQSLLNLIPTERDPDCLSRKSFEVFCKGKNPILPPVVSAIAKLIKEYKIGVKGKITVVVGRGRLVGLPVSIWLEQQGAKVIICDSQTENIADEIKKADIVISGAGKPNLITGIIIKKGAVVIDCGTNTDSGKTLGDIDFESVFEKAGYISPVPGGVGPLAVACLLENLLKLKK